MVDIWKKKWVGGGIGKKISRWMGGRLGGETSGRIDYKGWEDSGVEVGVRMGGGIGRYLEKEVGGWRDERTIGLIVGW